MAGLQAASALPAQYSDTVVKMLHGHKLCIRLKVTCYNEIIKQLTHLILKLMEEFSVYCAKESVLTFKDKGHL